MTSTFTEAETERLAVVIAGHAARITLRNSALNVIDIPMMGKLSEALAQIDARPDISTIVIKGDGKCFSAGVDVAAHTPDKVEQMLAKFHTVIRALISTSKVTIAVVHGFCLGGGAELAMACDMAYTTNSAHWGFPEVKLGCYPPVACAALAALVGQKRAAELILTGRTIDGKDAADIGLATRAVPADKLHDVVEETIAQVSTLSPAALAAAKKASYAWESMHFDKGLARAERIYFDDLMKTEDAHEGINAFLQKREPRWSGK